MQGVRFLSLYVAMHVHCVLGRLCPVHISKHETLCCAGKLGKVNGDCCSGREELLLPSEFTSEMASIGMCRRIQVRVL